HHADFIQRFIYFARVQNLGKKNRPKPLTAAQRATLREQLKGVSIPKALIRRHHRHAAKMEKDSRYCEFNQFVGSWKDVIERADREVAMDFLHHICETSNIGSQGTSWERSKRYVPIYTSSLGLCRSDTSTDNRQFHDGTLVSLFGLRQPNVGGKRVIGLDGLLALLTFTSRTTLASSIPSGNDVTYVHSICITNHARTEF
ncbi:hypothetical protein V8E54_010483, partial [Elaphomyces granulatus]